jgi:acyl-CoA synthetase (AMP-forming)/AMP-acid ligase II
LRINDHPADKIAYTILGSSVAVTYGELDQASNQGAHLFRDRGIVAGNGIAIWLPNHPEFLKITWAAQRSGIYYTPISTFFQTEEVTYILDNSDASLLITNSELLDRLPAQFLTQTDIDILLVDGADDNLSGPDYPKWPAERDRYPQTPIVDECEGAEMIYSSGTTGRPKGVRFPLTYAPLGTVSQLFKTRIEMHGLGSDTRYLSTAPMYHSAPLRYNMMVTRLGGTAFILEKFDAVAALEAIQQYRITHSQWVPTMFVRMLKLAAEKRRQYDVSSLRYAIHAAAPCPIEIKQRMIDWFGPIIYEYYSGTEANGSTAINSEEWLSHRGSVGRAIHGDVHILDDEGKEVQALESGTVFFANGSEFSYYKDEVKTAAAKNALGWSTLGDIGYVDAEGYLYLQDRKSFMIISGGVNIYPQEVENLLITHPQVSDVAVFGVPDNEFGEAVKAVVELMPGTASSAELAAELIAFCREQLSHIKCPRSLDFLPKLPRHPTGKLYKQQLKDQYWP